MGDNMPYVHEKGPFWSIYDSYFSDPTAPNRVRRKLETLADLHRLPKFTDANPELSMQSFASSGVITGIKHDLYGVANPPTDPPLNPQNLDDRQLWNRHVNIHWLGYDETTLQPPTSPTAPSSTSCGWWSGWNGNAEGIVRTAVIRAIEVSLGVASRAIDPTLLNQQGSQRTRLEVLDEYVLPGRSTLRQVYAGTMDPPRDWPIEFVWVCPAIHFEAAVSWQNGTVRTTWHTPGADHHPLTDVSVATVPLTCRSTSPTKPDPTEGLWMISQTKRTTPQMNSCSPCTGGTMKQSIVLNTSLGEVVTTKIGPPQGGAYDYGYRYEE